DGALAVRITDPCGEVGRHRPEHPRVERRRGLVVEVDRRRVRPLCKSDGGRAHAALAGMPRGFTRRYIAVYAARKCSISASAVFQPRLTRSVDPAVSGGRPIACRTRLGPTLPGEHA